jgi:hypothetical protein
MPYLVEHIFCIIASIIGGLCNYNTQKIKGRKPKGGHINWMIHRKNARIELFYNICIALASITFLIPPLVATFNLHTSFEPALAFFIGYSGMKLIPMVLDKVKKTLDKF